MAETEASDTAEGGGSDQGSPSAPPDPIELRFRNVTSDGRLAVSEPLSLARAVPPPPTLGTPWVGHEVYRSGGTTTLLVRAEGVQRGAVKFVVEKLEGGAWSQVADVPASFDAGQAQASYTLPAVRGVEPVQCRARAVASFGEATSDPWTVEPSGELMNPEWSHAHPTRGSHFDDGDEAIMRVQAKGLDGRSVVFVVEQQKGGAWAPFGKVTATIAGNAAVGKLTVRHPVMGGAPTLAQLKKAEPLQLRFHVELGS